MNKKNILIILTLVFFACCQTVQAKSDDEHYRTFEIVAKSETSLTLKDNDGNVIVVNKDPDGFRVGYKVRYDSIRKRLRKYRWQDYEVTAINNDSITLLHKTGDTISVTGDYARKFAVGDAVRYDSVGNKLQLDEGMDQWKQYIVVAAAKDNITLRSNDGQEVNLSLDNNLYEAPRGLFMARYKVGDQVRYNATTNQLRKGIIRTYDWQDYTVKEATGDRIILIDNHGDEHILENTYPGDFTAGDKVKYDRLNNLLKKIR